MIFAKLERFLTLIGTWLPSKWRESISQLTSSSFRHFISFIISDLATNFDWGGCLTGSGVFCVRTREFNKADERSITGEAFVSACTIGSGGFWTDMGSFCGLRPSLGMKSFVSRPGGPNPVFNCGRKSFVPELATPMVFKCWFASSAKFVGAEVSFSSIFVFWHGSPVSGSVLCFSGGILNLGRVCTILFKKSYLPE